MTKRIPALIVSTFLLGLPVAAQTPDVPAPTPAPAAPPSPPPAATFDSPWGIASSSSSTGNLKEWYPKMAEAGITWARVLPPEWSNFEPTKGVYKFEIPDAALEEADRNGIHVSGLFFGCPPWIDRRFHAFPMSNLPAWSDYAAALASHYKDRVRYWEVWNEGNAGFNDGHNNTADYAKLLSAAYEGAKRGNPDALVGFSVASFDAPYIGQAALALKQMGKPGQFDYICIHPYETFGGLGDPDGEILYLWMSNLLHDELKSTAPDKVNVPVWITEIGRPVDRATSEVGMALGKKTTEEDAGQAVVKAYIMALAQGIARVCWFEGQDPEREQQGYGLLRRDGTPRPAYTAMKTMTGLLGPVPRYAGWLAVGKDGRGYGFVFDSDKGPVLCAWMPVGGTDNLTPDSAVTVIDPLTGTATPVAAGQPLALGNEPRFVTGLSAAALVEAKANATKPYPWGGNYATNTTVSIDYTDPKGIKHDGVFQTNPTATPIHTFPDGSAGITVKGDIGHSVAFFTHPSFASIMTRDYYIRVTFRRISPGNVGWNFRYEVADSQAKGPMRNVPGWYSASPDMGWQKKDYHVTDASFGKMWGHDLSVNPEQSVPFAIGKVEVSTQPFAN